MRNPSVVMLSFAAFSTALGASAQAGAAPAAKALAESPSAIQIVQPFNKAVVRESVPIKLREFPKHGYVSVSIDGKFITAQALPKSASQPVYVWDTKAPYTDPDSPDTPKTYNDGTHALTIAVYNDQNKLVGQDSVSVQVADKINLPASQGIKMVYPWKTGLTLRYQRRTTLTATPTDTTAAAGANTPQTLQESLLRFERSVENSSGGTALLRDDIIPVDKSARPKAFVSYVATHGQAQALTSGIHAEYREVDDRGRVISKPASENTPASIGFSIPVLPPRRVSVGAHWEAPVKITLDWTSPYPATVTATSTLEDFEWQDRYPTAKIRETYEGPANFSPGPGSALPAIASQNIKFERIIYFAYNAGRVVRTQTTITLTSNDPGLLSAPGGGAGQFGEPSQFGGRGGYGGRGQFGGFGGRGGFGGGRRPTLLVPPDANGGGEYPGGGGEYGGGPDGTPPGGYGGPGGAPPNEYGSPGGYPGETGGYPGAAGQGGSPTKLTYSETAVLLT